MKRYWCQILNFLAVSFTGACALQSYEGYIPSGYTPTPIASPSDGLATAEQVAYQWERNAYLVEISGVYRSTPDSLELRYASYWFVSGDQTQYLGVIIASSGTVEVVPPAKVEGALVDTTAYLPETAVVSESNALLLAWERVGGVLATACPSLDGVVIEGSTLFSGKPAWAVTYSGNDAILGSVTLDAISGEVIYENINESICR